MAELILICGRKEFQVYELYVLAGPRITAKAAVKS